MLKKLLSLQQYEIYLEDESLAQASDESRTVLRNKKIGIVVQFHFLIKELTVVLSHFLYKHQNDPPPLL